MASLSVSVAMATFNGAAYLDRQLNDLAAQTVLPAELVICDDGSTDDTLAISERFAATAPFPVHIHRNQDRLGYRANFLKCASLCVSDLIAFCDQDDRWRPGKIETMRACFEDRDVLLAFHGADLVDQNEGPLGGVTSAPRPAGATPALGGSPWTFALGFTQVFRRWLCVCDQWWGLSRDHDSPHEPLAHDQWYFFLASALGTIVNVPEALADYRQHGGNVFGKASQTFGERVAGRIERAYSSSEGRAKSARQRALILDLAADLLDAPYAERAAAGAAEYRRLAQRCARRAAIYAGPSLGARARAFASLAQAGGYGSDPWRFGGMALAMDLTVGVRRGAERRHAEALR